MLFCVKGPFSFCTYTSPTAIVLVPTMSQASLSSFSLSFVARSLALFFEFSLSFSFGSCFSVFELFLFGRCVRRLATTTSDGTSCKASPFLPQRLARGARARLSVLVLICLNWVRVRFGSSFFGSGIHTTTYFLLRTSRSVLTGG